MREQTGSRTMIRRPEMRMARQLVLTFDVDDQGIWEARLAVKRPGEAKVDVFQSFWSSRTSPEMYEDWSVDLFEQLQLAMNWVVHLLPM